MSGENVELAEAQYKRWNAEDFEAWIKAFDPEVEYFSSIGSGLDRGGRYLGHDGLRRFIDEHVANWDYFRIRADEYIDAGSEVAVMVRTVGRMRDSDAEVRRDVSHVWSFSDGLVTRHRSFATRSEAVQAVGLDE